MFSKLAGNENVKQTLRHLLRNGRVPNSLLFAGDEGVGKGQFALELAKAFVCLEPNDFEACGVCAACRGRRRSFSYKRQGGRLQKGFL